MAWSRLELHLDLFLQLLIPLAGEDASRTVLGHIDFRRKIKIAASVGWHKKRSTSWFAELETVLNTIDNTHRPARNRYIHDLWVTQERAVQRILREPKLIRLQAHKRELVVERRVDVSPDTIMELVNRSTRPVRVLSKHT